MDILIPFAQTGRIGAARLGAELKDVVQELGPPWDYGSSTGADGLPYLYAYGSLEIAVCHAHCQVIDAVMVQTDWTTMEWPSQEPGQPQTFPGRPTYDEALRALDEAGCPWENYQPLTLEDQCAIRVPASGATFVFATDEGEKPVLCSVSVAQHRPHPCG
ncbi:MULTISPECIES: hypothetical protein [unclassified Streptomyces]|uniref:hypothetical protein n=1 Tax=unclassified Streptomyces TaxID=2593676 RepID=UPI00131A13AE|nr:MULTISPECIES: hypothetical protein [unclassified Streptomyces]MYT32030.1 hypothetical protein [Streptomyces sp. SID8354]